MYIGYFTERPYQDPKSGYFGATGLPIKDLNLSNDIYDPVVGAELYNRYLDEKIYAEEVGFDGLVLNEHHSSPFCMGSAMNVEAAILARVTKRARITLLGNVLPIWDDPLWLVEQLAMIDLISRGRPGFRLGAGNRPGEHSPQLAANRQLGAVPGGARVHSQGVDNARTLPMGGETLSISLCEPVGQTIPETAPAHLAAGGRQPRLINVGSKKPDPLHYAGHRPGAHQTGPRDLP